MIVDVHTHFYPDKIVERALAAAEGKLNVATDGTRAGLLASMDRSGIDYSLGLPLVNTPANSRGVNHWAVAQHSGRIVMAGSVHPRETTYADTLRYIADSGLPGIKMHPEYQHFKFSEECLYPIWEKCIELGLFVLTHAGGDIKFEPPWQSNPRELAAFHRRFPELKLILAHLGSMDLWDEVEEYLVGLPVYLDLAFIKPEFVAPDRLCRIIRKHGSKWILFGTDSPWCDQKLLLDYVKSLPLSSGELADILGGNAAGLLHLS